MSNDRSSIYERLRKHLEPLGLIERLGLTVRRKLGSEVYLQPLCHESASGESLQVNLHTGSWNCKACSSHGMRGDLFHLVEYALGNGRKPYHGQGQSDQRTEALRWLCQQYGEPFNEGRDLQQDEALLGLETFVLAAAGYLLDRPDVLEWIDEKWGFDLDTIVAHRIGFMPSPLLPEIVADAAKHKARYRTAGLGWYDNDNRFRSRFEGRLTFPYLVHGQPVYLIGRATGWTPPIEVEGRGTVLPPKYHKLSVHSPSRPFISPAITNHHLFNEPVLRTCGAEVGVVEGITDAIAFSHIGVDVVSPVTISFNAADLERFAERCHEHGVKVVWILFDNELSGSGNYAALRVGKQLVERGLEVRVITLPRGPQQEAARQEVLGAIGSEVLAELESSDPLERKRILAQHVPDEARRQWIVSQINAAKIDGAEWVAMHGAGAIDEFRKLRRAASSIVQLEADRIVATLDPSAEPFERMNEFRELIDLVAHLDVRQHRSEAAAIIAAAAGKGVSKKGDVEPAIAEARRNIVKPKLEGEKEQREKATKEQIAKSLVVPPPPDPAVARPPLPSPLPPSTPARPSAPQLPASKTSAIDTFERTREVVAKAVEARLPDEDVGKYIADVFKKTMGFMPFRTHEGVVIVRKNERVLVTTEKGSAFRGYLYEVSSLTPTKGSHAGYIAATEFHLAQGATIADDVSWSHVTESGGVFFPTGDVQGRLLYIEPGSVQLTRMSEARVPAVAGAEFRPFRYVDEPGGVRRAYDVFRWTSLSDEHRLVLIYWLVCLPILRRIGTVPIVRIEGGSSSGKTRAVEGIGQLVNGRKGSSVPTAAALISRLSREMLTIDDNRETSDVTPAFLGTLLQATHLGAREKRRAHTDTATVLERVCGALVMNGIEPVHDGKPELASRILPLRCDERFIRSDSPRESAIFMQAMVACRDAFWSEAVRLCAGALELDRAHGERLGGQIEEVFGATRIGRLSTYLRMMYLAWVAGIPVDARGPVLERIAPVWERAFSAIGERALSSLVAEELAVAVVRYVFEHGAAEATKDPDEPEFRKALGGKYVQDPAGGIELLGPVRSAHLARLARTAGKALNAPYAVSVALRAGQLRERLLDGLAYLRAAGFDVDVQETNAGRLRWTFVRPLRGRAPQPEQATDTWLAP